MEKIHSTKWRNHQVCLSFLWIFLFFHSQVIFSHPFYYFFQNWVGLEEKRVIFKIEATYFNINTKIDLCWPWGLFFSFSSFWSHFDLFSIIFMYSFIFRRWSWRGRYLGQVLSIINYEMIMNSFSVHLYVKFIIFIFSHFWCIFLYLLVENPVLPTKLSDTNFDVVTVF